MTAMKMRRASTALLLALSLAGTGCATWESQNRTVKGGVIGTGVGAATGAAIGAALGGGEGAWKGAAVGAAVGALGGAAIGNYMDRQAREMEAILARQDSLERRGETIYMSLSSDILFTTGSSRLQPGGEDKLREVAGIMQRYPRTYVEVVGHTDAVGSESMNQELSESRAKSVADVLVSSGVSPSRIVTRGAGELRPLADNGTAEGRARNRRVEIVIKPDDSFQETSGGAEPH
jgi:outer membrane protein OmpA-like peptidoglycan-associated protein